MGWAAEWGWSNPFSFYFAGRGGMLGDVGSDVVTSALGWFEPNAVRPCTQRVSASLRPKRLPARMAEAIRSGVGSTTPTSRISTASSRSPRRWSAGSRARPSLCSSDGGTQSPARRRPDVWRNRCRSCANGAGGSHLVATTAVGLSPLEAILTNEGPGQETLRVVRALPRLHRHQGEARRGGGDDEPAVCDRAGPGTRTVQAGDLRGGGPGPARRHSVARTATGPAGGVKPGNGYSEGLSTGGIPPTGEHGSIATTDLWCSSECTPPCQGGGRGFKSRQVRHQFPTRPWPVEPGYPVG